MRIIWFSIFIIGHVIGWPKSFISKVADCVFLPIIEERQTSFALSRNLESTLVSEEWKMVSALPESAAMETHDQAIHHGRNSSKLRHKEV